MKRVLKNNLKVGSYTFKAGSQVEVMDEARFVVSIKLEAIKLNGGIEVVQAFVRPDELENPLDKVTYFVSTSSAYIEVAKRVHSGGFIVVTIIGDWGHSSIMKKESLVYGEQGLYKGFIESNRDQYLDVFNKATKLLMEAI